MPVSSHLLERAYQLIDANQLQNAEMVLDALVRVDPKNISAWEAYLEIYQCCGDLEWGMERILNIKELTSQDKDEILAYQSYLIERAKESVEDIDAGMTNNPQIIGNDQEIIPQEEKAIFELLDEYDYPIREIERKKRKRAREMFVYTIPPYVMRGAGLLALFYISVRFIVLGYILGFLMLGGFIVGCLFWLGSLNHQNEAAPINIARAFSLENENDLYIIDKPIETAKVGKKRKSASPNIRYLDE